MKTNITFNVPDAEIKEEAKREAAIRGQTLNSAMLQIFEYGLEVYKEKVPVKFEPVVSGGEEEQPEMSINK